MQSIARGLWGDAALITAADNVASQGINMVMGQQKQFSWTRLAVSAISAPIAQAVGGELTGEGGVFAKSDPAVQSLVKSTTSALVSAVTHLAIQGGKLQWEAIAADALSGAACGYYDSQNQTTAATQPKDEATQEEARAKTGGLGTISRNFGQSADWSQRITLADSGDMMSDAVLTPTEEAMVKLASNPKANNDGGSTVDDDPLLDLFPLHTFAAEIEKQNAEAVARARNSGASLAPNVSNMLQRGIVLADTSSYWQMSQAADVLVLPDSPIDNAPKETEPFAQAMSRTGHTLLGVIEGGWNRTVADITRMALSPLTSEMPASETIDLDTGIVNRVPRSPEALAFARQMRGYADFQMIEPRNDAQRLGQRGFDVASTILGAYGLLGKAYNLTGTAFGEIGGANTGSTASKVSFESSLNAADRALGLNAGDAISANPVSAASYQRLLN